jgi:hypothetical protein
MRLIIEIDVDSSDMEEADVDVLLEEAKRNGATINIEVGSPLDGDDGDRGIYRATSLSSEYFIVVKQMKVE